MKILISSTEVSFIIDTEIICLEEWLLNYEEQVINRGLKNE